MTGWPRTSFGDGVDQQGRHPTALEPDYFLPQERRFAQWLGLALDLARELPFHDRNDRPSGDWGALYTRDDGAVMALILSHNRDRARLAFNRALEQGPEAALEQVYAAAQEIDVWLQQLTASGRRAGQELAERLRTLIEEQLPTVLPALAGLAAAAAPQRFAGQELTRFDAAWGSVTVANASTARGDTPALAPLRRVQVALERTVRQLQTLLIPYLDESLRADDHEPAVALCMVFVRLLRLAARPLNRFTERHLDFYYRQVLGMQEADGVPPWRYFSLAPTPAGQAVRLAAATAFVTPAALGGEVEYRLDQEAWIGDVSVDGLYSLWFERDRYISPECEFGYVTRVKAGQADGGPLPLFGATQRSDTDSTTEDADIGFALCSPVLALREGRRRVELILELSDPGEAAALREAVLPPGAAEISAQERLVALCRQFVAADPALQGHDAYTDDLVQRLVDALAMPGAVAPPATGRNRLYDRFLEAMLSLVGGDLDVLRGLLGRLLQRHLLCDASGALDAERLTRILAVAREQLGRDSVEILRGLLGRPPGEAFQALLQDSFLIELSTADGWHRIERYAMQRVELGEDDGRSGLRCAFTLGPEVPAVTQASSPVHGTGWDTQAPVARLRLNPRAHFCVYSLFRAADLRAVDIRVDVQGLGELRLSNQLGRLDPSKPFQPFGPLPTLNSYLEFGAVELDRKQLEHLRLNLEWADLPTRPGGLTQHYAGYPRPAADTDFLVEVSLLREGQWQPPAEQRRRVPLFRAGGPAVRMSPQCAVEIGGLSRYRPLPAAASGTSVADGVPQGLFRLRLAAPDGAFGHAEYPQLLAKTLTASIRAKLRPELPSPPYTPLLAQVSVDYRARARIVIDESRDRHAFDDGQSVQHLHPYGHEVLRPVRAGRPYGLLPGFATDGNLFVGIRGGENAPTLRLLFQLADDSHRQTEFAPPPLGWFYLSPRGWRRLPNTHLLEDGTDGLLRTGVVVLQLPEDLARDSTVMPAGRAWLRVGADAHLSAFPSLLGVYANGVRATRRGDAVELDGGGWRSSAPLPGLGAIQAVGAMTGGRDTEEVRRLRIRVSERLRHKARAVTAWDYERLVLQQFPEVYKTKCFPATDPARPNPAPGQVLVVVVPHAGAGIDDDCPHPMHDVDTLGRIREYLSRHASPHLHIQVRNPLYERIQVRCKVQFRGEAGAGAQVRRVNRAISDFLCPWTPVGYQPRFGWNVTREAVEAYIRRLEYVGFVTDFSMLQITEVGPGSYAAADTCQHPPAGVMHDSDELQWRYPWSLAVPMERHFIEPIPIPRVVEPEPVGVGELEVGGTFIIDGFE